MAKRHASSNGNGNAAQLSGNGRSDAAVRKITASRQNGSALHAAGAKEDKAGPVIRIAKRPASKKLGVGIIGCGYWGPNLVRNLSTLGDCKVHWISDLNEKRLSHLRSFYPTVGTTHNYEVLLNDKRVDAVVIATPVGTHHKLAKASLLAGKHVFVEKPLARSSAECAELVQLAAERGLTLMVGHTFLYSSPVRKVKEIIDRGEIGRVRYISARRLNLGLFQKDINVAWDLAPHDISIILYLLGQTPVSVNCRGHANVTPGIEDVTTMCLNFDHSRFASIQNSWLDPLKVREMTIVGDRRMILYNDVAPLEKVKIFDARVERPPHYDTFAEFQYSYHYGDMYAPYLKQEEPLKVECQHFLDCIRSGQQPISSGQDGWEMVKILEASTRSLQQSGAEVALEQHAGAVQPLASRVPQFA